MFKFIILLLTSIPVIAKTPSFEPFQQILNRHLSENKAIHGFETSFDYKSAYTDLATSKDISTQKKILKSFDLNKIKKKEEALSFWINSYNFFMITKVLEKGFKNGELVITSVKDLGSFFNSYAAFNDPFANIGGSKMSLDDIEKGWLLGSKGAYKKMYEGKNWKDARIHFAVNCASVGCPPLQKMIYKAKDIDNKLTSVTRQAMQTKRHIHFKDNQLRLTALFKWYKGDFIDDAGSELNFIAKFINNKSLKKKLLKATNITFIKYNWELNRAKSFKESLRRLDWMRSE